MMGEDKRGKHHQIRKINNVSGLDWIGLVWFLKVSKLKPICFLEM